MGWRDVLVCSLLQIKTTFASGSWCLWSLGTDCVGCGSAGPVQWVSSGQNRKCFCWRQIPCWGRILLPPCSLLLSCTVSVVRLSSQVKTVSFYAFKVQFWYKLSQTETFYIVCTWGRWAFIIAFQLSFNCLPWKEVKIMCYVGIVSGKLHHPAT